MEPLDYHDLIRIFIIAFDNFQDFQKTLNENNSETEFYKNKVSLADVYSYCWKYLDSEHDKRLEKSFLEKFGRKK